MLANTIPAFAMNFDAESTYNSIFVVHSGNSLGSGFAIGENCIVTNAHVVTDKTHILISTYSGEQFDCQVYCMDEALDIAILAAASEVKFVPLESNTSIKDGDEVYAIGAPNSMAYTLTKGVISSKNRKIENQSYIQTDAAINTGNSGGPLLNNLGQVIGVNSYKMTNSEGIGLAIPISTVISYAKENYIQINNDGVVENRIAKEEEKENSAEGNQNNKDVNKTEEKTDDLKDIILIILLGASVLLNILLVIILVYQKKKNIDMKIDPSERTDFDIDILE